MYKSIFQMTAEELRQHIREEKEKVIHPEEYVDKKDEQELQDEINDAITSNEQKEYDSEINELLGFTAAYKNPEIIKEISEIRKLFKKFLKNIDDGIFDDDMEEINFRCEIIVAPLRRFLVDKREKAIPALPPGVDIKAETIKIDREILVKYSRLVKIVTILDRQNKLDDWFSTEILIAVAGEWVDTNDMKIEMWAEVINLINDVEK